MISLTFAQFFKGAFTERGYHLYLVKDGEQVMYIGISRVSVWERWFSGPTSHMAVISGERLYGNSTIGEVIARRLPASWDWGIELWTREDCCSALSKELEGRRTDDIPITDLEALLINKLGPLYNATNGGGSREDPMISESLDDAYRKIFEK